MNPLQALFFAPHASLPTGMDANNPESDPSPLHLALMHACLQGGATGAVLGLCAAAVVRLWG